LEDLAEAYHLRRGIETCYGYIKEELQPGIFSGLSPVCVEQDFAATLFLFNLQSIIEKQCEPHLMKSAAKENMDIRSIKILAGLFSNIDPLSCFSNRILGIFFSNYKGHVVDIWNL
jgi:hypothetical protein